MCDPFKFCFIYYIYVKKNTVYLVFYTTCKLLTFSFTGICGIFFRVRLATEQLESSGRAEESSDDDETGPQHIHSERPQQAAHNPLSRRMKLKQDNSEKYNQVKESDRVRASIYRQTLSLEKKQELREKGQLRMIRYREKKASEPKPKLTATEIRKMRKKWREEKRRQRKAMSPGKKLSTKKRKIIKSALGLSPNSFSDLLHEMSPRKKEMIQTHKTAKRELFQDISLSVAEYVQDLKKKKGKKARLKMRVITNALKFRAKRLHSVRKQVGINRSTWKKYSQVRESEIVSLKQKTRSDALPEDVVESVHKVYEEHSTNLPLQRTVKKGVERKVLHSSTKRIHSDFKEKNPTTPVSLSKFYELRPKTCLTMNKMKFEGCLCEYCINIEFKVIHLQKTFTVQSVSKAKIFAPEEWYSCRELSVVAKNSEVLTWGLQQLLKVRKCNSQYP